MKGRFGDRGSRRGFFAARRLGALGAVLAGSLATATSGHGRDVYVDAAAGSDVSGDGTAGAPWKTISFALSQGLVAGDHVWASPGLYDDTTNGETMRNCIGCRLSGEIRVVVGEDRQRPDFIGRLE